MLFRPLSSPCPPGPLAQPPTWSPSLRLLALHFIHDSFSSFSPELGQRPESPSSLAVTWPLPCWPDPTAQASCHFSAFAQAGPTALNAFPLPGSASLMGIPPFQHPLPLSPTREASSIPSGPCHATLWVPLGLCNRCPRDIC